MVLLNIAQEVRFELLHLVDRHIVEISVDANILTIKVDLTREFGPSSSGKTIIIASTEGNVSIPGAEDKKIGLNVYKKK